MVVWIWAKLSDFFMWVFTQNFLTELQQYFLLTPTRALLLDTTGGYVPDPHYTLMLATSPSQSR